MEFLLKAFAYILVGGLLFAYYKLLLLAFEASKDVKKRRCDESDES